MLNIITGSLCSFHLKVCVKRTLTGLKCECHGAVPKSDKVKIVLSFLDENAKSFKKMFLERL